MSHNAPGELLRAAAAALDRDRELLVRRTVGRLTRELRSYAGLPSEQLAGDLRTITGANLRAFAAMLVDERSGPSEEHLAAVTASAAQRAEESVPVNDVVRAYFLGVQTCLSHLHDIMGPSLTEVMPELTALLLAYLREVSAAVANGYVQERQLTLGDGMSARLQLAAALVDGGSDDVVADAAALAGLEVAPSYTVLALAVGTEPSTTAGTGGDATVVRARTVRRVRTRLLGSLGPGVLWLPGYRDALVLVPGGPGDPAAVLPSLPVPVIAGVASGRSAGAGVSVAARTALEVRDLAVRLGRPPGCHGIADVALEYQISRPGPGQEALAAAVSPLDQEPVLTSTLRTFVEEARHRQRTARRLGVHPNTVDNRLRRIAALTGLDPNHPRDMTWLEAAMAATRLLSQLPGARQDGW